MDRAGSDLEGVKKSLIKARPEGHQVGLGDYLLVTSGVHQGLRGGGGRERERRLGEKLGRLHGTTWSGGRWRP